MNAAGTPAVVGDVDADSIRLAADADDDAGAGVAQGVGEQRADDAFEEGGDPGSR
ncbi:hypothetical protein [Streptomyces sp. KL116D]|uniref:hypothetical protein n=1 Tax=Streptomyces sp. KL116D TaxID=3045152 RepID=UPI00355850F6